MPIPWKQKDGEWRSVSVSYCCCNKWPQTSGLKQNKFIILQFWRSEVQNGFPYSKIKDCAPFRESGGQAASLPFLASGGACIPLLWGLGQGHLCEYYSACVRGKKGGSLEANIPREPGLVCWRRIREQTSPHCSPGILGRLGSLWVIGPQLLLNLCLQNFYFS
jgi:hypothetical protein